MHYWLFDLHDGRFPYLTRDHQVAVAQAPSHAHASHRGRETGKDESLCALADRAWIVA